ncbi:symplekin-like isoform X1 [Salvia splendens]|uniref:symplekin-like isoform X1 n=2 Tax=Salvia splendens TaxID=180675 RepID=UPI001C278FD9|nr:symplekin-like isoform X1 [Salvia splendens]
MARDQALSLLAAANNHGDLAVKLSSLKQAKDILFSVEPSQAAELFSYLAELQSSPEPLVRKYLLEVIDDAGAKGSEHLVILFPVLLTFLKDNNPIVATQSIITGTKIFSSVLEELALQFQRRGIVQRWLEELWTGLIKFRDAVLGIIFEAGPIGPKLLSIKFLETFILCFTLDSTEFDMCNPEVIARQGSMFNVSWIADSHPILNPHALMSDANRHLEILLEILLSASKLPGCMTITAVNSLVAIARKRPVYYKTVLKALLDFSPSIEMAKGRHTVSIQYSLRTAFLGFLRCTHPIMTESREKLLKELRAMNAGDAADQVIRQMDKIMRNNERASRELQFSKDDQLSSQLHISGELTKKRTAQLDNENQNNIFEASSKKSRHGPHNSKTTTASDAKQDHVNGISAKPPVLDGDLTPVEQMIAMIGALIAEGERGVESLEILISNIHADLLADIVITNMKHLPKNPPPLTRYGNLSLNHPSDTSDPAQVVGSNGFATSTQSLDHLAQLPASSLSTTSGAVSDTFATANLSTDSKRDPRRDPRRLDPRRLVAPTDMSQTYVVEENVGTVQHPTVEPDFNPVSSSSVLLSAPQSVPEFAPQPLPTIETDINLPDSPMTIEVDEPIQKYEVHDFDANVITPDKDANNYLHLSPSSGKEEDVVSPASMDLAMLDEAYSPSSEASDELPPDIPNVEASESASAELPVLPLYIELDEDHQIRARRLALERIINKYQNSQRTDIKQTQIALVARLFAQIDVSDVIEMAQKLIISDYEEQKGHELVLHILYHLHSLVISDSASSAAAVYENFLLGVAKSLLVDLPASNKSFSRLLGEVPNIPDSVLGMLDDMCTKSHSGADGRDGDRVTQGLGAVWSLILSRPFIRQACLDIALKCTVHPKDDIQAKAIRLVSNKLYAVSYISNSIEQFAKNMFLSAVDQHSSDALLSESAISDRRIGGQVEGAETSTSGSQVSEPEISPDETMKGVLDDSSNIFSQAHRHMSLFFALCAKKPVLLQLVFDSYTRSSKAVKQAVHRHITVLMRALGSSYSDLLHIISNPPQGSEDLLTQVLHLLSEGRAPPTDLVVTVKHLYETRLKDATILIPILSAFSRDEVLPIFPRLVQLPLPKFQMALAHILQGSAHTGPALTPVEVLVAIHDISPERDSLPLKKITDTCSACFEQRTVFTQQVLAKALNQMVDRTPLPLLFMRTVIQAIDAFPSLVDFVMDILSKLVNRQVWRMPKQWVGFLKCISQTQPHSFKVLLQLPSPQLESALSKYPNLRGPLAAYTNQSSIKTSVPRTTLVLLGLASETQMQQPHAVSSLHASDGPTST